MSTDKNHSQNGKSPESGDQTSFTQKHNDGSKQDVATAADWDETVRQAENEKGELKPGQSQSGNSEHNNNGRGGGK
jgi:hypothetical protein